MLVDVSGKVSDIEKAFQMTLRTYRHPAEARDFFAPDAEPAVAAEVPVLHVSGLDNYMVPSRVRCTKASFGSGAGIGFGALRKLHGL